LVKCPTEIDLKAPGRVEVFLGIIEISEDNWLQFFANIRAKRLMVFIFWA